MSTRLLNSRTVCLAVALQRFSSGRTEAAVLALKQSAATALKLAGVSVKTEESDLYDSQSNGLADSVVKDAKGAVRTNFGLSREALRTEVRRNSSSCCDSEHMQERFRLQDSL